MPKAEYRSAIRSRKLINDALADLLQEKPLDKITVTDVVRRADINRGTFYAHYADIPDVIEHLVDQTFCRIRDAFSQQSCPLTELPAIILLQVQTVLEEDLDFYRKVMVSNISGMMQEKLCSVVLDYLLEHEDEYSVISHEEFVFMMRFCTGGLGSLYRDWFAGELPLTLDQLTRKSVEMLNSVLVSRMQKEPNRT